MNSLRTERARNYQRRYASTYTVGYDGNAARPLERREETAPHRSRPRRKKRPAKRLDLEVREPGKIAPFAVIGLVAVCLLCMLFINRYANLVAANDDVVQVKSRLTELKEEEDKLMIQYEKAYDLKSIEEEFLTSGEMIKRQDEQLSTLELSEPDSVEYYEKPGFGSGIISGIRDIISAIGTYF